MRTRAKGESRELEEARRRAIEVLKELREVLEKRCARARRPSA